MLFSERENSYVYVSSFQMGNFYLVFGLGRRQQLNMNNYEAN